MTKLEEVARAIFAAEYDDLSYTMTATEKVEYSRMALAAIEAMREPTGVMEIVAGNQAYIIEYYRKMIDAVLNEKA